jgi:hypothetical protein
MIERNTMAYTSMNGINGARQSPRQRRAVAAPIGRAVAAPIEGVYGTFRLHEPSGLRTDLE